MVAVGTRITRRPPHRSRRALLTHRALPSEGAAVFDHLGIVIKDPDKSLPFYEACLAPLGIRKTQDQPQCRAAIFMIPGTGSFLWIGAGAADQPQRLTGYFHLAFSAP